MRPSHLRAYTVVEARAPAESFAAAGDLIALEPAIGTATISAILFA